ncbi:MAG: hypothetical protein CME19_14685 [Gemmatimonadetes bacterium]|nr:hypothetical protein [Gemmatimonadota bacterium]
MDLFLFQRDGSVSFSESTTEFGSGHAHKTESDRTRGAECVGKITIGFPRSPIHKRPAPESLLAERKGSVADGKRYACYVKNPLID